MWKVEYTKRFLKDLANLPSDIQEGSTEAFNQLVDHPAVSIVLVAAKGLMDA